MISHTQIINTLGHVYAIGIFTELSELHHLSVTIFEELSKEFDDLSTGISRVYKFAEETKEKAVKVLDDLFHYDLQRFFDRDCTVDQIQKGQSEAITNFNSSDYLVRRQYSQCQEAPSLVGFACRFPNYQEMDKQISDPSLFEKQYLEEMMSVLEHLNARVERKERKPQAKKSEGKSSALEHGVNFVDNLLQTLHPPTLQVLLPPSVEENQSWKTHPLIQLTQQLRGTAIISSGSSPASSQYSTPSTSANFQGSTSRQSSYRLSISAAFPQASSTPPSSSTPPPSKLSPSPQVDSSVSARPTVLPGSARPTVLPGSGGDKPSFLDMIQKGVSLKKPTLAPTENVRRDSGSLSSILSQIAEKRTLFEHSESETPSSELDEDW